MPIVMPMPTISKATLKTRLLEFLRDLEASGEPVIITSYGTPVAQITRLAPGTSVDALFADVRGALRFATDPDEPTTDEWSEA